MTDSELNDLLCAHRLKPSYGHRESFRLGMMKAAEICRGPVPPVYENYGSIGIRCSKSEEIAQAIEREAERTFP